MKKITFCKQNLELGSQDVLDYANKHLSNEYEIRTTRCLGECGECFSNLIVDFHGKLLVSETSDEMIKSLLKLTKE